MPRITIEQSHKYLKKEYRFRFFAVFFWFCALSILFSIIFLLPSYLLLNFYKNTFRNQGQEDSQIQTQRINEEYNQKLEETYQISRKVSTQPFVYVDIIEALKVYALESVQFDAIELSNSGKTVAVTLRGRSPLREQLLTFEKKINADTRFEGFKLPIDVLTKQEDLSFNVTFTYHEN